MRSTTVVLRRWTRTWAVLSSIPVAFALVTSMLPSVSTTSRVAVAGLLAIFGIWSYLDGPASYVAISERQVSVANMFRRYVVPRSLVEGFEVRAGGLGLELVLRGLPPIPVLAANLPVSPGTSGSGRHFRVKATRLNEALAAREPAAVAGTVERRIRSPPPVVCPAGAPPHEPRRAAPAATTADPGLWRPSSAINLE